MHVLTTAPLASPLEALEPEQAERMHVLTTAPSPPRLAFHTPREARPCARPDDLDAVRAAAVEQRGGQLGRL